MIPDDSDTAYARVGQLPAKGRVPAAHQGGGLLVELAGQRPHVADTVWIAPTAAIIGAVTLSDHANVWYGATIRTESEPIFIGVGTNLQDNCVVHTDPGAPIHIGDHVTVGHGAILHGCSIDNGSLIGMGAVIMNGAVIGAGSLIAAGTVIPEEMVVPPRSLVAGVPGKIKRQTDGDYSHNARNYAELAQRHRVAFDAQR
jgi:carbonic anhydrase/acetyltransferase-like protein (isoleucine patch superfamily)